MLIKIQGRKEGRKGEIREGRKEERKREGGRQERRKEAGRRGET